jgi:hypothetical protein
LGMWDVCCMYRDLSEKGVIVDRLDLEFESRMWLQRQQQQPERNAIAIDYTWGVRGMCAPERSAIVNKIN